MNFLNTVGNHVLTKCQVGGQLEQYSYTNNSYVEQNNEVTIDTNASAKFYISVDTSTSSK